MKDRAMNISFIVTSFNIAPYIRQCLESLHDCVDAGDEVLIVDDGSDDETPEMIEAFIAAGGYGPDVPIRPIYLGANTPGGVGIPANIGLAEAQGEAVFFVDGDDWLVEPGFRACRRQFESQRPDILIGNYLEYDEKLKKSRSPADQARWGANGRGNLAEIRMQAIAMIAVPWRKFYRRDFLERHRFRFPEGKFFYEDNPFHWAVCIEAQTIAFCDSVLCQHRINRPGQTMSATGAQLAAFFTHYDTISALLDAANVAPRATERLAAVEWLLGNMAWHLERLNRTAFWDYATIAARSLRRIDAVLWQDAARGRFAGTAVLRAAEQLRKTDPEIVVALWFAERGHVYHEQINRKVDSLARDIRSVKDDLARLMADEFAALRKTAATQSTQLSALLAIREFEAMQSLLRIEGWPGRAEPEPGAPWDGA